MSDWPVTDHNYALSKGYGVDPDDSAEALEQWDAAVAAARATRSPIHWVDADTLPPDLQGPTFCEAHPNVAWPHGKCVGPGTWYPRCPRCSEPYVVELRDEGRVAAWACPDCAPVPTNPNEE